MNANDVRQLFHSLTEEELQRATNSLEEYLILAWEIMEGAQIKTGSLTVEAIDGSIEAKVDTQNNKSVT